MAFQSDAQWLCDIGWLCLPIRRVTTYPSSLLPWAIIALKLLKKLLFEYNVAFFKCEGVNQIVRWILHKQQVVVGNHIIDRRGNILTIQLIV